MDHEELELALDAHDELLRQVADGRIALQEFTDKYDSFYWSYALDGHEELPAAELLVALRDRIDIHRRVAEEVLSTLAPHPEGVAAYAEASRITHTKAVVMLGEIAASLPQAEA